MSYPSMYDIISAQSETIHLTSAVDAYMKKHYSCKKLSPLFREAKEISKNKCFKETGIDMLARQIISDASFPKSMIPLKDLFKDVDMEIDWDTHIHQIVVDHLKWLYDSSFDTAIKNLNAKV